MTQGGPESTSEASRALAILGFHKIGQPAPEGWSTWYYVPEPTFVEYLRCLKDEGWQVIDLETLLRGLAAPESLPARTAVLTFDDGYRSVPEVALPWLRRFGYPAVMFVPTAFIGGRNVFDHGEEPEEPICDWDDLRALERAGVSIQSHGVSHRPFSELDSFERTQELERSKRVLEAGVGKSVEVFCYPYGDSGADSALARESVQRAGYRAACLYDGGLNRVPVADPYRLDRLAMGPDTDLRAELAVLASPVEGTPR